MIGKDLSHYQVLLYVQTLINKKFIDNTQRDENHVLTKYLILGVKHGSDLHLPLQQYKTKKNILNYDETQNV